MNVVSFGVSFGVSIMLLIATTNKTYAHTASNHSMRGILDSLRRRNCCDILVIDEATIVDAPIEQWPLCDLLLCFESVGFPLEKGC